MKIFPTKELQFKLIDSQEKALDRLKRRTEKSRNLTSDYTDKSFRGIINGNSFKIISSSIGKGALCVLTGTINTESGSLTVTVHKAFKVLLSILMCFPIIGVLVTFLLAEEKPQPMLLFLVIGHVLIIRFVFITLAFNYLSKESLNRLRDVLDIEWVKENRRQ